MRHRAKFPANRSIHGQDMVIFQFFKDGVRPPYSVFKSMKFNYQYGSEGQYASACQIWCQVDNPLLIYSHFFQFFKMAVLHLKSPTPSENVDFDRFRLIVPQPCELAKNSIIANRKLTMCFPSATDVPCALPLSPPKCASKREFLFWVLLFISLLHVIVNNSNLVCGLNIANVSLQMTNCF